jgi:predicted ATPase
MITRIEIDGFKSFVDFELDVPPFLVIVGSNNGGKSNLLEAVEFVRDGFRNRSRVLFNRKRGNLLDMFHRDEDGEVVDEFRIRVGLPGDRLLGVDARLEPASVDLVPANDDPTHGWLFLQPDPALMRRPASFGDQGPLVEDGSNLAAVLARFATGDEIKDLMIDAAGIIPHLQAIEPVVDEARREVDFDLVMSRGGRFRPTVASDGTLRTLAILAAAHDLPEGGTLIIDEIETGLHPSHQGQLLRRLRNLTRHKSGRQIIVTTHSPVVLSEILPVDPNAAVYLSQVVGGVTRPDGSTVGRVFTHARTFRAGGDRGTYVTPQEVRSYLNSVRSVDAL